MLRRASAQAAPDLRDTSRSPLRPPFNSVTLVSAGMQGVALIIVDPSARVDGFLAVVS